MTTRTRIQTTIGELAVTESLDQIIGHIASLPGGELAPMDLLELHDQYGDPIHITAGHIVTMRAITNAPTVTGQALDLEATP